MGNKKAEREKKKARKRMNKIIIGIVSAVVLVAVVVTVGIGYKKNEAGKRYTNNDVSEMKWNIEDEVVENGEIKINSNETSNENDLGIKLSNYVVAGSEEAKRSEEILKKAQEEKEKKEIEKNKRTKYAGKSTVQLASNTENTRDIRSAVQEIATIDITGGTLTLSPETYEYNGQRNAPDPTLIVEGKTLILGKDYKIEYTNNINAGIGTATATGINEYTGTKTANFTITPKSINVEWQGGDQFVYNSNIQKPTVKSPVTGVNGDQVYLTVKIQGGKTPKDVGNYVAEAEITNVVKGTPKTAPGTITVTSKITTDNVGNTTAGSNVPKGTTLYIQITATQTNGTIKSIYSAQNSASTDTATYSLEITENGTYGFAVVGSENTSTWYTVTVDNYIENQVPTGLQLGDYVSYTPDNNAGSTQWRVWKIDEGTGTVIITPVNGIGSLTLRGAEGENGWLNAETAIEKECDKYISTSLGVTADNIQSMKIEDIEEVMPASQTKQNASPTYGTDYEYSGGTFYAEKANGSIGTFDGYNKALSSGKSAVTLVETYWYLGSPMWYSLGNTKNGMMSDTYGTILGNTHSWLASRCVYCDTRHAYFNVRCVSSSWVSDDPLYDSDGYARDYSNGVRPLVSLSSTLFAGGGAGTSDNPWQLAK